MSKEMKVIMERWDKFKLQEKVELETVGQFKKFLRFTKLTKFLFE